MPPPLLHQLAVTPNSYELTSSSEKPPGFFTDNDAASYSLEAMLAEDLAECTIGPSSSLNFIAPPTAEGGMLNWVTGRPGSRGLLALLHGKKGPWALQQPHLELYLYWGLTEVSHPPPNANVDLEEGLGKLWDGLRIGHEEVTKGGRDMKGTYMGDDAYLLGSSWIRIEQGKGNSGMLALWSSGEEAGGKVVTKLMEKSNIGAEGGLGLSGAGRGVR